MRESRYWLLSLITAACLIILLGVHLFLMHLDTFAAYIGLANSEPLDYTAVMARGKSLGWAVGYVALLGLALYHGLYGLRSILCEIVHPGEERLLTWAIIGIGLVAFAFGSYVIIMSYAMEGI